jgi:hypothetical protein
MVVQTAANLAAQWDVR